MWQRVRLEGAGGEERGGGGRAAEGSLADGAEHNGVGAELRGVWVEGPAAPVGAALSWR